ncbi:MAG: hypothetical protein ACI84O_000918 [Myxococcota bacterium]|jgi:hypothetical protein
MLRKEINKLANSWTFKQAFVLCVLLYLWAMALMSAATSVVNNGAPATASACMFALLLPMFWLLVYRWYHVLSFFRSVRVAVTNMCFLALGAMIGVLIQQEDVSNPTPQGAVQELVALGELQSTDAMTQVSDDARLAYSDFKGFREAEAFFIYHLANNIGLRGLLGFDGEQAGDEEQIQEMLANLDTRLPEIEARFGEEKSIAIRSQSETGLRTRAKNSEIYQLEQRLNDSLFSLFVIADKLDMRRAYRSDWYAMMWTILFFGILSSLLRNGFKFLLKKTKWGFAVTHTGMLLIIIGGLIGRTTEIRGIVELNIGQNKSAYKSWSAEPLSFTYNPTFAEAGDPTFALQLDDFRADQHDVLDIIYVSSDGAGGFRTEFDLDEQPKLRVFEGLKQSYDYPVGNLRGDAAFSLEILEYAAQTTVVREQENVLDTIYLSSDGAGGFRRDTEFGEQPTLRVFEGLKQSYDYPMGDLSGDAAFSLEILEYAAQTTVVREPETLAIISYTELTDTIFTDPAPATIKLKLTGIGEDGKDYSEEVFLHAGGEGDGIPFSYFSDDGTRRIVWLKFHEDRSLIVSYAELADTTFFDPAPATIKLKLTGIGEDGEDYSEEVLLHAGGEGDRTRFDYFSDDGTQRSVVLNFHEDRSPGSMPLEWQSKLSILEFDEDGNAQTVAQGAVRVNDYFVYAGYRFFQTNHNPNDPTYSGIGVVYDPGINWVLWGLYSVMSATAFIFLIRPLIYGSKIRGTK